MNVAFVGRQIVAAAAFALAFGSFSAPALARDSDAQIRQKIIKASIANYPRNCPCPYNVAANGSRCGGRSAWNRGGGYSPKCFAADVTQAEVNAFRKR